jgi:hypothetical protein
MARGTKPVSTLGFLTIVDDPQHGACGGFLVLNASGRPLEFHCTMPLKPNRAQEILYGPTLRPYLYGEQIGATLIAKAATAPAVVCTDLPDVLAARPHVEPPLVLVLSGNAECETRSAEFRNSNSTDTIRLGSHELAVAEEHAGDREAVLAHLEPLGEFDLLEPFGRIREAIEEAQRGSR